mmetsp:Transcript_27563/g.46230  ORF Transcript_27563/g.46230 Transcript_27563/m.46230 type:complete len:166 (+) Transcript_27563:2-499(+)
MRENKKAKIYFRNQDPNEVIDKAQLTQLDKEIAEKKELIKTLKNDCGSLDSEIRGISSSLTDEEIAARIQVLQEENEKMTTKLKMLEETSGTIDKAAITKAEKRYEFSRLEWRKRKRLFRDIFGTISEQGGLTMNQAKEEMGVETDEEIGVKIEDSRIIKRRKLA